jgi:hypothetical protein
MPRTGRPIDTHGPSKGFHPGAPRQYAGIPNQGMGLCGGWAIFDTRERTAPFVSYRSWVVIGMIHCEKAHIALRNVAT